MKLYDPVSDECVPRCPDEHPYADNNGVCSDCPAGIQFWTGDGCAKSCPETYDENKICRLCREQDSAKPVWRDNVCTACEQKDGGVYWDATSVKCVPQCPPERPTVREGVFCDACSAEKDAGEFWFNGSCVETCPETWTELNHCVACKTQDMTTPVWANGACRSCDAATNGWLKFWSPAE